MLALLLIIILLALISVPLAIFITKLFIITVVGFFVLACAIVLVLLGFVAVERDE